MDIDNVEPANPEVQDSCVIAQRALNILECPVCMEYMVAPIKQCIQGHSICNTCHSRVRSCPCCRSSFTNTRNIALETLASSIPLPCPNATWGCTKSIKIEERKLHKAECYYKPIKCRDSTAKCTWTGTLEQFKEHCRLPNHYMLNSGASITLVNLSTPFSSFCVSALNKLFLFKQKFVERTKTIYWAVQFIGDGNEALNYVYEVRVTSTNTSKKAKFQHICQSIFIEDKDLFNYDHAIPVNIVCIIPIAGSVDNKIKLSVTVMNNQLLFDEDFSGENMEVVCEYLIE